MNTKLVAALAAAALLAIPAAVGAGNLVTVTLTVDGTQAVVNGQAPYTKTCDLQVPAGADGGVVLTTAVAEGCLDSWQYEESSFGRFLTCIDGTCGGPLEPTYTLYTYWSMSLDGEATPYGIDDYKATDGDALGFTYTTETWLIYLLP
ncbi:MAG TPA: DUF4430 domain-containing protein [Candidatus Thermoplasmatota archaeon]|nr:DUF4430 domain-containing protein [Candidatus Thermoplasmatota archaeon]